MKKYLSKLSYLVVALVLSITSCQMANAQNELKATEFKQKMDKLNDELLLDVRTPEEYAEGHIANSMNIDWTGDAFDAGIAKLDKTKPVFVYCRSGKRSAAAASSMRTMGFKQVYELKGGIMAWESAGLLQEKGTGK